MGLEEVTMSQEVFQACSTRQYGLHFQHSRADGVLRRGIPRGLDTECHDVMYWMSSVLRMQREAANLQVESLQHYYQNLQPAKGKVPVK